MCITLLLDYLMTNTSYLELFTISNRTSFSWLDLQLLHNNFQLLEVQQQLAVAVSAERKKDAMIEQLDKVCERNP